MNVSWTNEQLALKDGAGPPLRYAREQVRTLAADSRTTAPFPTLAADELHVWWLRIGENGRATDHLRRYLSSDEVARANRFALRRDSRRYADTRGSLRLILGGCIGVEPNRVEFEAGEYGKPRLTGPLGGGDVEFNVSHSGSIAIIGVSARRRVGVDVEQIRRGTSLEQVAEHFFSDSEQATLAALAPEARTRAFFDGWVRKEAYVKGRGEGLTIPLQDFSVSLEPREPAMTTNRIHPEDVSIWSLHDLGPPQGYAAAAAVEGGIERIRDFDLA